jgi:hypothetical protein
VQADLALDDGTKKSATEMLEKMREEQRSLMQGGGEDRQAAMAKVNEMAGGDALKAVGMQNQAAYTLQSLAKDLGVDPTTLAAAVSKSPELLDTFMQRFSQASGNSEQAKMLDAQTGPTMQDFALANANLRNAALRTGRPATFGISPGIMPR